MLAKMLFIFLTISPWYLLGEETPIRNVFFGTKKALFPNKDYFYFPKPLSGSDIKELIDPTRNGIERLVVYFYKDIKRNELKIYIPNIVKQRMIPNLAYEDGDYLINVTSQEIFDIFNTNPNVVDATSVYDRDFDISISKEPLCYNIGKIHENSATENTQDVIHYVNLAIYVNNDEQRKNANGPDGPYSTDINYTPTQHMTPKNQQPEEPLSVTTESIKTYPNNNYLYVSPLGQPPTKALEDKLKNINNIAITEQVAAVLPVSMSSDYAAIDKESSGNSEISKLKTNNAYSGNTIDLLYPDIVGTSLESPYLIYMSEYPSLPKESQSELINAYKGNYFNVFKNWFKDQMEGFRDSQSADNDLNDEFVRRLVKEILLHYNMLVTKDGSINKDGVKLSIKNLNLRPITISDSVGYNKLLKAGEKLNVVSKLTYSKAVLISLVNKLKGLDLISLDKTDIPNKNTQPYATSKDGVPSHENAGIFVVNNHTGLGLGRKPVDTIFQPLPSLIYKGLKDPNYKKYHKTATICDYSNCRTEQSRLNANENNDIKINPNKPLIEHAPQRINYKLQKALMKKLAKYNELTTARKIQRGNKVVGEMGVKTQKFLLAKLFSQFLSLLNPEVADSSKVMDTTELSKEISKTEDTAMSLLVENDYEEGSEEETDDEDSMYRIIGGTPATGSGAPLNVRGKRFSDS